MKHLIAIIFIGFCPLILAQKKPNYSKIDNIVLQIPDSLTRTTTSISGFINSNFPNQSDKARAVFFWIAKNIQYDIDNMFAINFNATPGETIDKVLKTRKGICMHYAELFTDIANQVGIKAYMISGYTKQNGFVDYIPHAWCAGLVDTTWFLFDPTWGSGYIENSKFVRKVNNSYFKVKPEQLIKSHIPFDPLWQFLNYPITNQEFYEEKFTVNKAKPFFNYIDSLVRYEKLSEMERLVSSSNRIELNGVKNSLIFDRLQHNKREIEYFNNKRLTESLNSAVYIYNDGVNLLNKFIDYRNKQFTPKKSDAEIKQMIDTAEYSLTTSRERLNNIKNPDSNISTSMTQLSKSIDDEMNNLNEQKTFLNKYLKTNKRVRKSLFYKYTWNGIPIN